MKTVHILGATGSIGVQTIDIIEEFSNTYKLGCISANHNIEEVLKICQHHSVDKVVMDGQYEDTFKQHFPFISFKALPEGLIDLVDSIEEGVLMNALVGRVGLEPTLKAIEKDIDVLLANKESLVVGGPLIKEALKKSRSKIIPVDSEHAALAECLRGSQIEEVERLIITASGGSFRDLSNDDLKNVTVKDALNHPNWSMGAKITIDSATMMNKVFEIIEAHYLFDVPYHKIEAILHKESLVHGIVEFQDGNVLAHMGPADMRIPILAALQENKRMKYKSLFDLTKIGTLHFEPINYERFTLFELGVNVAKRKDMHVVTMNAANEVAVLLFLNEKIGFLDIERLILKALHHFEGTMDFTLENVLKHDEAVRNYLRKDYT